MQKRRSVIVDEIMREYYQELRWKERMARIKEQKERRGRTEENNEEPKDSTS